MSEGPIRGTYHVDQEAAKNAAPVPEVEIVEEEEEKPSRAAMLLDMDSEEE